MIPAVLPTFELRAPGTAATLVERTRRRLKTPGCPLSGVAADGRLELHVHGAEQHLWSPQLIVDLEETTDEEGNVELVLRGRFGPHPSVWTLYVFAYSTCGMLAFVGGVFGFAQLQLAQPPWGLVALPAGAVVSGGLYGMALLGQGLSREQMGRLRAFLEECATG